MVPDWPLERLRERLATDDVEYIAVPMGVYVVVGVHSIVHEKLRARTIIRIGSTYLVEDLDQPGSWYMGCLQGGEIVVGASTVRSRTPSGRSDRHVCPQLFRTVRILMR